MFVFGRFPSHHVGVDGPQAVAVRHTEGGGASAAQRMRSKRGRARPDEGSRHGNRGRRPSR